MSVYLHHSKEKKIDITKVSEMKPVVCWFSGGITSAVACKLAIDLFG